MSSQEVLDWSLVQASTDSVQAHERLYYEIKSKLKDHQESKCIQALPKIDIL